MSVDADDDVDLSQFQDFLDPFCQFIWRKCFPIIGVLFLVNVLNLLLILFLVLFRHPSK